MYFSITSLNYLTVNCYWTKLTCFNKVLYLNKANSFHDKANLLYQCILLHDNHYVTMCARLESQLETLCNAPFNEKPNML
jgi:hypothetical protein